MAETAALEAALWGHVDTLCLEIGPRAPFLGHGLLQAQKYIGETFDGAGLEIEEQGYDYFGKPVANVIARPPGQPEGEGYYLIGAHYDSVPMTPGADDNASAVAVLLELAKRMCQPPLPLRFAAFTLEEPPAFATRDQGSRVYARRAAAQGDRILGAIVLEMVGYTCERQDYPLVLGWAGYPKEGNFIGVVADWRSRKLGRRVLRGLRRNPRLPVESLTVPLRGWVLPATRLSDHASFWDRGWPALMITDTAFFRNPNYHSLRDRPETLDYRFMAELVLGLELAIEELAQEPR